MRHNDEGQDHGRASLVVPDDESLDELVERLTGNPSVVQDPVVLRRELERTFTIEMRSRAWAGPQASPETIQEYETITPGVARELWDDFFEEGRHRRAHETKITDTQVFLARTDSRRKDKGLWCTTGLVLIVFGLATALALYDKETTAIAFVTVPLVIIVIGVLSGGDTGVLSNLARRNQRDEE